VDWWGDVSARGVPCSCRAVPGCFRERFEEVWRIPVPITGRSASSFLKDVYIVCVVSSLVLQHVGASCGGVRTHNAGNRLYENTRSESKWPDQYVERAWQKPWSGEWSGVFFSAGNLLAALFSVYSHATSATDI